MREARPHGDCRAETATGRWEWQSWDGGGDETRMTVAARKRCSAIREADRGQERRQRGRDRGRGSFRQERQTDKAGQGEAETQLNSADAPGEKQQAESCRHTHTRHPPRGADDG